MFGHLHSLADGLDGGQAKRFFVYLIGSSVVVGGRLVVFDVGLHVRAVEVEIGIFMLEVLFLSEKGSTALL